MPSFTQAYFPGEYVASEAAGQASRTMVTVTVAGGVALPSGTVLGKITASGKFVRYNAGASDGSQSAAAILYTPLPGLNRDHQALAHDRDCEVNGAALNGGLGADADARMQLATRGIRVRGAPVVSPLAVLSYAGAGGLSLGNEPISFI